MPASQPARPLPPLTRARAQELLSVASTRRVLVIGDAMLDRYLYGDVDRISPEAPVPVVRLQNTSTAPGGAANVAMGVAALGVPTTLVTGIGSDDDGQTLRTLLERAKITLVAPSLPDPQFQTRPTSTKTRIVARGQHVVRYDREVDADVAGDALARVLDAVTHCVSHADVVVLEDYDKGILAPAVITAALTAASARRIPVIVDPKHRHFFSYGGATIFKPNRHELASALQQDVAHDDQGLLIACGKLRAAHLLLTLGADGMALASQHGGPGDTRGQVLRLPTTVREVFDVVGAGDTVSAGLAAALAAAATVQEAAQIANVAAGIVVGKAGTATVTVPEILAAIPA